MTTHIPSKRDTDKRAVGYATRESGFTLIEVMVALAILAVVAVAASRASSAYLSSVEVLQTRTLAHFVAQNAAAELRIQQTPLNANSSQIVNEQGRDWQITLTVGETATPELTEVTITVAPIIEGQVGKVVTDINMMLSNAEPVVSLNLSHLSVPHLSVPLPDTKELSAQLSTQLLTQLSATSGVGSRVQHLEWQS